MGKTIYKHKLKRGNLRNIEIKRSNSCIAVYDASEVPYIYPESKELRIGYGPEYSELLDRCKVDHEGVTFELVKKPPVHVSIEEFIKRISEPGIGRSLNHFYVFISSDDYEQFMNSLSIISRVHGVTFLDRHCYLYGDGVKLEEVMSSIPYMLLRDKLHIVTGRDLNTDKWLIDRFVAVWDTEFGTPDDIIKWNGMSFEEKKRLMDGFDEERGE